MDITNIIKFSINEPNYAIKYLYELIFKNKLLKRISLFITYKCNLRCQMCPLWKGQDDNKINEELSIDKIKELIDELYPYYPKILLTGGEPLLREDWVSIAEYIIKKKLRCYLQTNGTYLKEYKNEIVNYIDFLNVSIDGTREIHDRIRGNKSFDEILQGIEAIDKLKKEKGKRKPYINICYTITFGNYKNLEEIIVFLNKLKIPINELNFQHFEFIDEEVLQKYKRIYQEQGFTNPFVWDEFYKEKEKIDIQYLADCINKIKNSNNNFKINFYPDFKNTELEKYYHNPISIPKNYFRRCKLPFYELSIYPNGDIWSCPSRIIGNVNEESLTNILDRIKIIYREAKNNLSDSCNKCGGELYIYYMNLFYLLGRLEHKHTNA